MNIIIVEKNYTKEIFENTFRNTTTAIIPANNHILTMDEEAILAGMAPEEYLNKPLYTKAPEKAYILVPERIDEVCNIITKIIKENNVTKIINGCDSDKNGKYLFDCIIDKLNLNSTIEIIRDSNIYDLTKETLIKNFAEYM